MIKNNTEIDDLVNMSALLNLLNELGKEINGFGKWVPVFAVPLAAGNSIKYQSFAYVSFV